MKKLLLIGSLLSFGLVSFGQKVGHINTQDIMEKMPEYKEGEAKLDSAKTASDKSFEFILDLYKKKENEYRANEANPEYPREVLEDDYNDLMGRQQKLQQLDYENQQKLEGLRLQIMDDLVKKIQTTAGEVAKENGVEYVFEASNLIYAGGTDLTDLILKKMGIQ